MSRIAIVVGHPRSGTYCEALGESYARGAVAAEHRVDLFLTSTMQFDPILREGFERPQPLEPDLLRAHDALLAADHLVLIFPLWLGMMPSILHGFLERVFQPDLVPASKAGKFPKLLKGKSVLLVVTMGMPAFLYQLWFRSYVLKLLKRNVFRLIGAAPVHSLVIGNVEEAGDAKRKQWLDLMEQFGRRTG